MYWFGNMSTALINMMMTLTGQVSVLIAIVLAAEWIVLNKLPSRWRLRIWTLAIIRLLLPVAPATSLSVFNYFSWSQIDFTWLRQIFSSGGDGLVADTAWSTTATMEWIGSQQITGLADAKVFVMGLWLAGMAFLALLLIHQQRDVIRRIKAMQSIEEASVNNLLRECKKALGIDKKVGLVESDCIRSPVLVGFWRPRIVLPQGLVNDFSRTELRYVLLHELAHLKRRDILWNWLITFVHLVHWFNPLVWLAVRRIRAEREFVCDQEVLARSSLEDSFGYGRTILKLLERNMSRERQWAFLGFLDGTSNIQRRIEMITKRNSNRRLRTCAGFVVLAFLALLTLTNAKAEPRLAGSPGEKTKPKVIEKVQPQYTQEAKKAGIEGKVILTLKILANGQVSDVYVKEGLPYGLSKAAADAVQEWKFEPAMMDGKPVDSEFTITVAFRLGNGDGGPQKPPEGAIKPVAIEKVSPVFPEEARKELISGEVVLGAEVLKDGSVGRVRVVQGLAGGCTQAAVDAIKQWKFKPGMVDDKPVDMMMTLKINFHLE